MTTDRSLIREALHSFTAVPQTTGGTTAVAILTIVAVLYLFRKLGSRKFAERDQVLFVK